MAEYLKLEPCPFCGDVPELPSGDGTQYEIECGGCGQAMASVQICDLMTRAERATGSFTDHRYGEQFIERAKLEAIERWNTRAQLPSQGGEAVEPACWQYKVYEERRFYPTDPRCEPFWDRLGPDGIAHSAEPLYTHPADQVAEGVVVSRELLDSLLTVIDSNGYAADEVEVVDELRALLAKIEGVKP